MKEKIINEAITLFSQKGYYNTSLNEIAQTVGIKKASLYYHFKNKEDICIKCIQLIESKFTKIVFECYKEKKFSYRDYYNLLYYILFIADTKYIKFMIQLMYVPKDLSRNVIKLMIKFKKSFNLISKEYYKYSNSNESYTIFYYFVLNNSISWIYKAAFASNYNILDSVKREYINNMRDLCKNTVGYE